jgi:hypothetical protein
MLAVFRRASLEWKTPEDLIAFLPSYLQAEAEILDREVLIIRTAGHNERLAVPIRMLHDGSALGRCFDFVTDSDAANNAPAVLLATDTQYEVVSKGLIAQAAFLNALGRSEPEVQLVVQGCSPEALEKRYAAALRQIEAT